MNDEARTDSRLAALQDSDVSAALSSNVPIVVEKTMYMGRPGQIYGAALASAGAPRVSTTWHFAEGETGAAFNMFLVMMNPGAADALVEARYLLPSGEQDRQEPTRSHSTAACVCTSIKRIRASPDTRVAVTLTSTNGAGIVAERAMFWPGAAAAEWDEASASLGLTSAGTRWGIAAGEVGGPRHSRTNIALANLSSTAASVAVTLLFEDGGTDRKFFRVGATTRFTIDVGREFSSSTDKRFAAVVEGVDDNRPELIVECSMYSDGPAGGSKAGWSAPATPLEPSTADSTTDRSGSAQGSRSGIVMTSLAAQAPASQAGSFNIKVVTDASPDLPTWPA